MGIIGSLAGKVATAAEIGYSEALDSVPAIVSVRSYTDTAMEITGIVRPLGAAIAGFKLIAYKCLPPKWVYAGECLTLGGQIYIVIQSGGSWPGIAILFWLSRQVLTKK